MIFLEWWIAGLLWAMRSPVPAAAAGIVIVLVLALSAKRIQKARSERG